MEDIVSKAVAIFYIVAVCGIAYKMESDSSIDDDLPVFIHVLKKEILIFLPITILMVGYQIYTSGDWGLSPKTTSYIAMFPVLLGILPILTYKFAKRFSKEKEFITSKFFAGLCFNIVLIPATTIVMLIVEVVER